MDAGPWDESDPATAPATHRMYAQMYDAMRAGLRWGTCSGQQSRRACKGGVVRFAWWLRDIRAKARMISRCLSSQLRKERHAGIGTRVSRHSGALGSCEWSDVGRASQWRGEA